MELRSAELREAVTTAFASQVRDDDLEARAVGWSAPASVDTNVVTGDPDDLREIDPTLVTIPPGRPRRVLAAHTMVR